MPVYPLFALGQEGKSPTVTAQRHVNIYAEPSDDKSQLNFYGTPGTTLFTSFGDTPVRGWLAVGDFIYCVHRGTFYEVNNAGVRTARGTIGTTEGRVRMSFNGTQLTVVDGGGQRIYVYTVATNAFDTVTTNLIGTPIDVTYQDSYTILTLADGRIQISAQYDSKTLDALDFATAESNPDGLVRGIADHGELVLCGENTTEFWGNSGGQDFPYSNIRGATLEWGLAAPSSLVKYNDSLAGLFKNVMGQVQVMMLAGHALKKISSPELDSIINGYSAVSDATAIAYMLGGHPMYQINFPTAGKSWLFDSLSGMWSPLESGLSGGRHIAELHCDYINQPRVADYANGNIYTLDPEAYTDNGTPIVREIVTKHVSNNYQQEAIHSLQLDFETGVGLVSGQGSDPQAMLQVSRDNGHTWGNERWVSMGAIGKYKARVKWNRLGAARDFVFKIRVTDPVKFVLTGGSIEAEPRR
jgi:hypothetical protein